MATDSAVPPIARVTTAATHPKGTLAATLLGSSLALIARNPYILPVLAHSGSSTDKHARGRPLSGDQ